MGKIGWKNPPFPVTTKVEQVIARHTLHPIAIARDRYGLNPDYKYHTMKSGR